MILFTLVILFPLITKFLFFWYQKTIQSSQSHKYFSLWVCVGVCSSCPETISIKHSYRANDPYHLNFLNELTWTEVNTVVLSQFGSLFFLLFFLSLLKPTISQMERQPNKCLPFGQFFIFLCATLSRLMVCGCRNKNVSI